MRTVPYQPWMLALSLVCSFGCAEEATAPVAPIVAAGIGEPCSAALPCTGALLCVDGLCTERGSLPEPGPDEPDVWTYLDIGPGDSGDALTDDSGAALDGADDAELGPDGMVLDTTGADGASTDSTTTDVVDAAAGDAEDASKDAPEDETEDAGPAEDVETETVLILLKDDSVEAGAGDTFFLLNEGEAWVAELSTPVDGQLKFVEVFFADVSAPKSCGRFRIAVWAPDENGLLPDAPTFVETEEHLLVGGGDGQTVPLTIEVDLPAGTFRLGVIHDGPCSEEDFSPALMSDDSGVVDMTWLWIPVDGTPPWVPASVFGVDGRWAIRGILEGEKVSEP